jgi:hypothetical protein
MNSKALVPDHLGQQIGPCVQPVATLWALSGAPLVRISGLPMSGRLLSATNAAMKSSEARTQTVNLTNKTASSDRDYALSV